MGDLGTDITSDLELGVATLDIVSPAPNSVVAVPLQATLRVRDNGAPPGVPGVIQVFNEVTGELLASVADPTGTGDVTALIDWGKVMALRAGTVTPSQAQVGTARRGSLVLPQGVGTARRSGKATGQKTATARRAGGATLGASGKAQRASSAVPQAAASARRAATVLGQKAATTRLAGTTQPQDTTAPAISGFSIAGGTNGGTFSATITDAVGVTKYKFVEGASDPGTADPGQTGATTVASTTSLTLTNVAWTSGATSTSTRYGRLHTWDAAGNHGVSSVASATVTVGAAGGVYAQGLVGVGLAEIWVNRSGASPYFGYFANYQGDDGESVSPCELRRKDGVISPVPSLGSFNFPPGGGGSTYLRLERDNGTGVMRLRSGPSATGPWTTQVTATDTNYSTGSPAFSGDVSNTSSGTY